MRVWLHRLDDTPSVLLVDDRPENLLALAAVLEPLQVAPAHGRVRRGGAQGAARGGLRGRPARRADAGDGRLRDGAVHPRARAQPHDADHLPDRRRAPTSPQVARGYEAGAVDYVLKPFEPNMLRSKVSVFCDLERQRRARARADEMLLLAWRSLPTGAALIDADGRLLRANPVLQKLSRGPRGRRRGRCSTLVQQDDRLALDALLTAALAGATVPAGRPSCSSPATRTSRSRSSPGACASTTARSSRCSSRSTTCASAAAPRPRASA